MQMMLVKKVEDMRFVLGVDLANLLLKVCKHDKHYRSKPHRIAFTDTKPSFYLGDSETLFAYLINLEKVEIVATEYCGSYDTILHHLPAQLGKGGEVPTGYAVVFQRTYYVGGRNFTAYNLTVVSSDLTKQIGEIS